MLTFCDRLIFVSFPICAMLAYTVVRSGAISDIPWAYLFLLISIIASIYGNILIIKRLTIAEVNRELLAYENEISQLFTENVMIKADKKRRMSL